MNYVEYHIFKELYINLFHIKFMDSHDYQVYFGTLFPA